MSDMRPVFGMSKEEQEALVRQIAHVNEMIERIEKPEPVYLELSEEDRLRFAILIKTLAKCTFQPGSYEKRFVRDMRSKIEELDWTLTEKQREFLKRLSWRYRRQLPAWFNPGWDGKK